KIGKVERIGRNVPARWTKKYLFVEWLASLNPDVKPEHGRTRLQMQRAPWNPKGRFITVLRLADRRIPRRIGLLHAGRLFRAQMFARSLNVGHRVPPEFPPARNA